jgi:hypothetical protein
VLDHAALFFFLRQDHAALMSRRNEEVEAVGLPLPDPSGIRQGPQLGPRDGEGARLRPCR